MSGHFRVRFALVLLLAAFATPLPGQDADSRVAPRGMLRVQVGGEFATADTRFGGIEVEVDEEERLSTPFPARLTAAAFAPLQQLQQQVNALAGGEIADPTSLYLNTAALLVAVDHRRVPFRVELGVLPRLSVAVMLPLVQSWVSPTDLAIADGTIGLNPDPTFNQALLATIDETHGALGGGAFLPTAGSAVGVALQERVRAAADGQELRLPAEALTSVGILGLADAAIFATGRYSPTRPAWAAGDAEVSVRLQLLNTTGQLSPGTTTGAGARAAVEIGARLPTGTPPTADYLILPPPEEGLQGLIVGFHGDLFASPRLGLGVAARWESFDAVEIGRRVWSLAPETTFPPEFADETAVWEPGSRLTLHVMPRVRLLDEISFFAGYALVRRSGESYLPAGEGATPLEAPDRSAQQWRAGMEFSTLPAFHAGRTRLPFEASIAFRETFGGSGGAVAARQIEMQARFFGRLWGRRRAPTP